MNPDNERKQHFYEIHSSLEMGQTKSELVSNFAFPIIIIIGQVDF